MRPYTLYSANDPAFQFALKRCQTGQLRLDLKRLDPFDAEDTQQWFLYMSQIEKTYSPEAILNDQRRVDHMLTMAWAAVNAPPMAQFTYLSNWLPPLESALRTSYAVEFEGLKA